MSPIEVSIVVETHTLGEGGRLDRFERVLHAVHAMLPHHAGAEVLVADTGGAPEVRAILERAFPTVRRVDATGLGYDAAKMKAAEAARGTYVLYCDGDCLPAANWSEALLTRLRSGRAVACAGYMRYEGGFAAAVASVMDFGFLYPRTERALSCYASNSSGFVRDVLLREVPFGESYLRCACYFHAQRLWRRGTPVLLAPDTLSLHEPQPLLRERSRQGYDRIAACWTDPELPETRHLRLGLLAVPLFYARDVRLDWRRLWAGRRDLGLSRAQAVGAMPLFPLLRLLDAAGMVRAVVEGPRRGGWSGWLARRRSGTA
jgi:hypothetical protein